MASLKFPSGLTAVAMDPMERFLLVGGMDGRIFFVDMSVSNQDSPFAPFAQNRTRGIGGGDSARGIGGPLGAGVKKRLDDLADINNSERREGEYQNVLIGHEQSVSSLCVSREGNVLVSGSLDGTARVWDLYSGQVIKTYNRLKGPVTHVAILSRPQSLYLVDEVAGGEKSAVEGVTDGVGGGVAGGGGVVVGGVVGGGPSKGAVTGDGAPHQKARVPSVKPFKNFLSRTAPVYAYQPLAPTDTPPQSQQPQQKTPNNNTDNTNNSNKKKKGKQNIKSASEKNDERRMEELLVAECVPIHLKRMGGQSVKHYSGGGGLEGVGGIGGGGSGMGSDSLHLLGGDLANNFWNEEYVLHNIEKHMRDLAVTPPLSTPHHHTTSHITPPHRTVPHHTSLHTTLSTHHSTIHTTHHTTQHTTPHNTL